MSFGIPGDANQVMVVAESTHWDPNWMLTSSQYYRLLVRRTLDQVLDALTCDPRRVFGLESVFFVDLYWNDRPERRGTFRTLVERGQLVFSGCGVTTPDTLLPTDEMLLRDLLIGQEWIRSHGMTQEPRTLYLPDSFGHSPALPSVASAAGIDNVAFYRIDGMFFAGGETDPIRSFPRPGSSAESLEKTVGPDFIWQGPDGSEVLAHWLAHGYGHGDMIASRGFTRTLQLPLSWSARRPKTVARRIRRYADELATSARTPYLLLALGHDFVAPVPDLVSIIDEWNRLHYDSTGLWLVNASMEDYFSLVSFHRDRLDTIEFDPNPCWSGFYASRPDLKATARRLHGDLIAADHQHAVEYANTHAATDGGTPVRAAGHTGSTHGTLMEAWWTGVTSNHHDFITGTSPDRVAHGEQQPALQRALQLLGADPSRSRASGTEAAAHRVEPPADHVGTGATAPDVRAPVQHVDPADTGIVWSRSGSLVKIELGWARAVFDEARGGTLRSLVDRSGRDLIEGCALALHSHRDGGGLWRMGFEFRGGTWRTADRSCINPSRLSVSYSSTPGAVVVSIDTTLENRPVSVRAFLSIDEPQMIVDTVVSLPNRRTVSVTMPVHGEVDRIDMHQPGGFIGRPLQRCYDPTYWPLHSFAHLGSCHDNTGEGRTIDQLVVAVVAPTAIHVDPNGEVHVVVARSAVKELAYGMVPILAPVWGRRWSAQRSTVAFRWPTVTDDTRPSSGETRSLPEGLALHDATARHVGIPNPEWAVRSSDPAVETIAVKRADRGKGLIVRLRDWHCSGSMRTVPLDLDPALGLTVGRAWLTDSRERDLRELYVHDGTVEADLARHLTTVRLEVVVTRPDC